KKFSAAASTRTTACPGPATGSGRSAMARSAGVRARVQRRSFMVGGSRLYMGSGRPLRTVQSRRSPRLAAIVLSIADLAHYFAILGLTGVSVRSPCARGSDEADDTEPTCPAAWLAACLGDCGAADRG